MIVGMTFGVTAPRHLSPGAGSAHPSAVFDFAGQTFPVPLTTDRGGVATARSPLGQRVRVPANAPRFDFTSQGMALGLLVERATTNLVSTQAAPENLQQVSVSGGGAVLSLADDTSALAAAGLDTMTNGQAYRVDNTAGTAPARLIVKGPFDSTVPHVMSACVRGTGQMRIRTGFGSYPVLGTLGNGYERWQVCTTQRTVGSYSTNDVMWIEVAPGCEIFVALPQVEAGRYATSYVPTAGAPVTRAAEEATASGQGWLLPDRGTLVATLRCADMADDTVQTAWTLCDAAGQSVLSVPRLRAGGTAARHGLRIGTSTPQALHATGSGTITHAVAWDMAGAEIAYDGVTSIALPGAVVPAVSSLHLGGVPGEAPDSHIARITYYPQRLSGTDLRLLCDV